MERESARSRKSSSSHRTHGAGHGAGDDATTAAHAASRQQRQAPTDGPSEDDRWGAEDETAPQVEAKNVEARILRVTVVNQDDVPGCRVVLSCGSDLGASPNMPGSIDLGREAMTFRIETVQTRYCTAFIPGVSPDALARVTHVVINPQ